MPSATFPLLFKYLDLVFGTGFIAEVVANGRYAPFAGIHRMKMKTAVAMIGLLCATLGAHAQSGQATDRYQLVAGESSVLVHVGAAGLFSFAGHVHEVRAPGMTGTVQVDQAEPSRSTVAVEFNAAALEVTGKGEPAADVPEVQRVMRGERVLDVQRFPVIVFRSTAAFMGPETGGTRTIRVIGNLTLHGVTRPVTVSGSVIFDGDRLVLRGRASIRQSEFGISPVTAAGGTVRVENELGIELSIVARTAPR